MSLSRILAVIVLLAIAYLTLWPVPIDPVAWSPQEDPGLEQGVYAPTALMDDAQIVDLKGRDGPEDFAVGPDGAIYTGVHDGAILRYDPDTGEIAEIARTGGRPLGLDFGPDGTLFIADAYLGLLAVDSRGGVGVIADTVAGTPIAYADDLAVMGRKIYFSDASTKFGAKASGGTLAGSILELMEHRKTGRILEHDLDTGETVVLADGFAFPNGVTPSVDGDHIVVAETGEYRLLKIGIEGGERGRVTVLIDNLPGFPDNVERGPDGNYWVGLTSPRLPGVDALAEYPFIRKIALRLPPALRPKPAHHGAALAIDPQGRVKASVQDPSGVINTTAGALRTQDALYISRLEGPNFARLSPPPASR